MWIVCEIPMKKHVEQQQRQRQRWIIEVRMGREKILGHVEKEKLNENFLPDMLSEWKRMANVNEELREKNREKTQNEQRAAQRRKKNVGRKMAICIRMSWPTNRDNILLKWFGHLMNLLFLLMLRSIVYGRILFSLDKRRKTLLVWKAKRLRVKRNGSLYWMWFELFSAFFARSDDGFPRFVKIHRER